ncbi:MAG: bifunctional 5,10-methylenetetrahydrofolate dehydrogenase/5,10-methenyltetrahydrofolate cyclohydrolase [Candidatus Portnoybacteria bacterium]|nr:bifunctional 5,10-methylenetetrahydrofolate dehydrogenase/5,10-methenyltetrahydrofolate cyclohydrolase [Candidatus Portnoybacteria bacterium]MDD4982920.1 bifunctional 5,10-methylenetetrahydrofolate dehydrogenase/5,10-methenyltetrahydrofolate cyclohydrolase [Candidatus Portnoybacteria bacterium]
MKLFNGKALANKILKELKESVSKEKRAPKLAIVLVGDDEASKLYIKLKKAAAAKVGIEAVEHRFGAQAKEDEITSYIKHLNEDTDVNGIIVQLPLPAVLNVDRIIDAIDPAKDVDGFHKENKKLLERSKENLIPVLPSAILAVLQAAMKNKFDSKKMLALVNSEKFGETLKIILKREGADIDYMVRNTCVVFGAEKKIKEADILISVCGCPQMIKGEMIKEGAILVDAGVTRYHDGKVAGDVDAKSVEGKAAFLTPVPGGLGPLTVALLLRNVYLASKKE